MRAEAHLVSLIYLQSISPVDLLLAFGGGDTADSAVSRLRADSGAVAWRDARSELIFPYS